MISTLPTPALFATLSIFVLGTLTVNHQDQFGMLHEKDAFFIGNFLF